LEHIRRLQIFLKFRDRWLIFPACRILDRENQDLLPYLKDINVFIHLNRLNGRNVLVFSDAGYSRAPTIILQYLIQVENMSLAKSLILLTSQRYQPNINSGFMKTLRKLERKREFVEPMLNSPSWKPAWHWSTVLIRRCLFYSENKFQYFYFSRYLFTLSRLEMI